MATAATPPAAAEADPLLGPAGAAPYIGVQEQTLAVWRSTGRYGLPFIKVGRLVKYRRSDLDAFLERNTRTSTV